MIVLSNTAHAKNGDHDIYERVRLDPRLDITTPPNCVCRLSTTLVSRLVLNLRERNSTLASLPTTMESERKFEAALPAAQQAVVSVGNIPSAQQNKSI